MQHITAKPTPKETHKRDKANRNKMGIISLLRRRDARAQYTRQLLHAHAKHHANDAADNDHQQHRNTSQEEERHAHILLLASRAAPLDGLDWFPVIILPHDGCAAPARPAVANAVISGLFAVPLEAESVPGAAFGRVIAG